MTLEKLPWTDRIRYLPEVLGYPWSALAIVLAIVIIATFVEGAGVALVYPILEVLQNGGGIEGLAERSAAFRAVVGAFTAVGLPVSMGSLLLTTAALFIVRQVFSYLSLTVRAFYSFRAVQRIAGRAFGLLTAAAVHHAERTRSGTIVNALFTESKRAASLANALQNLVGGVFKVFVYILILTTVSWQGTLLGLSLLVCVAYIVSRSAVRGSKLTGRLINEANDRLTRYVTERFGLFKLMKIQGTETAEARQFEEEVRQLRELNVSVVRYGARIRVLVEGAAVLGGLALIFFAITYLKLDLAALGLFLVAIFRLIPVIQEMAVSHQQIAANLNSVYYIDRICLDALAAAESDTGTDLFPGLSGGIRFDNISFTYPPGDDDGEPVPALHDIDLTIPAGRTTALLGPSGAGKSTLIDLIPRLRAPTAGQILFDDVPAEDIRLADLRGAIAMVSQDTLIIDGTVSENLRYGRPDATDEQIVAAAKAAFADDFIQTMPKGYDTVVGERGVLLSGGQKQRIALARAMLAKAPVLLLDEPTSALDAESEQAVQRALETLQTDNDVTIIIIAHRLSTVRHADQIVVLEHGRLLGTGTHDSLMESAPWYRKVVELQTGERVSAPEASAPAAVDARTR